MLSKLKNQENLLTASLSGNIVGRVLEYEIRPCAYKINSVEILIGSKPITVK